MSKVRLNVNRKEQERERATYLTKFYNLPHCANIEDLTKKILLQSKSGVNFINVLGTAFTPADPESVKRLNCIFYAFGIYKRKSCT